ncbi:MAG: hypothetical protein MR411_00310 [Tenericutes bacterium]|nr:hypothetical protein [Mycoplasmatota bacterium]MDY3800417.1 hypothetical protein [Bacilli bacterium]
MNNFNEIINSLDFELDELKQVKKNIYLNNREMQILKMYDIDFQNCVDMNDLLFKIDNVLNDLYDNSDIEDLEWVSSSISERNYYMNTNK